MAPAPVLYAVTDYTKVEETKILFLASLERAALWGRLLTHEGRKVMAPVADAKLCTKFEKLQLQYLCWNTFELTPPEDYEQLVQSCKAKFTTLSVDTTDIRELQQRWARIEATLSNGIPTAPPLAPDGTARPASAPRKAGATKAVWDVADELRAAAGGQIPDRKTFIAECERRGINGATASTQFSKWKNSHVRTD